MSSTPYQLIYSRFAQKVQDYNLDALYSSSIPAYESFIKGYLVSAIPLFTYCIIDLDDRDDSAQIFNNTLSGTEQEILSILMHYLWMVREVNNIMDMRLALSSPSYKRYAESNNLKAKSDNRDSILEMANGLMSTYSYKNYNPVSQ
jgi:hypothetical protein